MNKLNACLRFVFRIDQRGVNFLFKIFAYKKRYFEKNRNLFLSSSVSENNTKRKKTSKLKKNPDKSDFKWLELLDKISVLEHSFSLRGLETMSMRGIGKLNSSNVECVLYT